MIEEGIIEELKSHIGIESEPFTIEVEKGAMIKAAKGSHVFLLKKGGKNEKVLELWNKPKLLSNSAFWEKVIVGKGFNSC